MVPREVGQRRPSLGTEGEGRGGRTRDTRVGAEVDAHDDDERRSTTVTREEEMGKKRGKGLLVIPVENIEGFILTVRCQENS